VVYNRFIIRNLPFRRLSLTTKACPECGSEDMILTKQGNHHCQNCGLDWSESAALCPRCGHANETNAESCEICGESLSVVDRILRRQVISGKPQWLQDARERAPGIKEHEEVSSRQRLEMLMDVDRKREEELRIAKQIQSQQERRTLSGTLIFTAAILVIIVIATLAITLRG
jgi:hypothetical protein